MGFNLGKKKKECLKLNSITLPSTELSVVRGVRVEAARPRAGACKEDSYVG